MDELRGASINGAGALVLNLKGKDALITLKDQENDQIGKEIVKSNS